MRIRKNLIKQLFVTMMALFIMKSALPERDLKNSLKLFSLAIVLKAQSLLSLIQ